MDTKDIAFTKLLEYLEKENYQGYDPYDSLNSWIPFHWLGKMGPVLAIQFQKRNPVNIRPLIGIRKEINPKAFGLFLQGFCKLYSKTRKEEYLEKAKYFFEWLNEHHSSGYNGIGWGYNFPWASTEKYLDQFVPSSVVTGFVCRGIYEYYKITGDVKAFNLLEKAGAFISKDLPIHQDSNGVCISYTPIKKDCCYNASLLAAETLAISGALTKNKNYIDLAVQGVNWVIHHQKPDGRWNYSIDLKSGKEREQIDFHQGYILESIFEISDLLKIRDHHWEDALLKGSEFYYKHQFLKSGQSLWRFPETWPVDIHNQSQGIITFKKIQGFHEEFADFAEIIANWTITNMQDSKGFFYYRLHKHYKIRIPYMRWSQAWMMLALTILRSNDNGKEQC